LSGWDDLKELPDGFNPQGNVDLSSTEIQEFPVGFNPKSIDVAFCRNLYNLDTYFYFKDLKGNGCQIKGFPFEEFDDPLNNFHELAKKFNIPEETIKEWNKFLIEICINVDVDTFVSWIKKDKSRIATGRYLFV